MKTSPASRITKHISLGGNIPFVISGLLVSLFILITGYVIFDVEDKLDEFNRNVRIVKTLRDLDSASTDLHRQIYVYQDSLSSTVQLEIFIRLMKLYEETFAELRRQNTAEFFLFDSAAVVSDIRMLDSLLLEFSHGNSNAAAAKNSRDSFYAIRNIDAAITIRFDQLDKLVRSAQRDTGGRLNEYHLILSVIAVSAGIFGLILLFGYARIRRNLRERFEIEEELNAERNKYLSLAESMDDAVLITDREDIVLFANSATEQVTGYTPDEIMGRSARVTLTDSANWPSYEKRLAERLSGKSEEYFIYINKKDNSKARVYVKASPFRSTKGEVIGTIGVLADLSEQMKIEREATLYRENLTGVIENSSDFIWAFDHELKLIVFNTSFKTEFKKLYHAEIEMGMQILDYVGEVQRRAWLRICKRALSGERIHFDQKYEIDGEERVYSVSLNPLKDSQGTIYGIAFFMSEITSRIRNEEELRAAMETAEQATRLKTEFLANMSHEIRTPLNGILGMANLLMDTELNEYQRLYANSIKESGASLLGILNDILDISKVEAGKIEILNEEFDFVQFIESIAEVYSVQAENKNISFYIEPGSDLPSKIRCDRLRLNQILTNILTNAFKFTEAGYVNLVLKAAWDDDLSGRLQFTVEDTGPGMTEETLANLFTEYVQADASVVRKFGGTGLGLSISKKLAELMGGSISVSSERGKGSSFTVEVPYTVNQKFTKVPLPQQSGLVLVVTSENKGGEIIASLLSLFGYTPVVVYNAANALVRITRMNQDGRSFAFILCNYNLPGYDGYALLKQINENYANHPPLFLLIGRKKLASLKTKIPAANITALAKPFCTRTIKQIIELIQPIEKKQPPKAVAENMRKLNILIADDNRINRTVITGFLAKLGHEVTESSDGREALDLFLMESYDMIMLDCQMPIMDGYQVSRKIREYEKGSGKRIPIIGVTANNSHDEKEKCLAAGMDDFLVKPFEIADLRRIVELNTVYSQIEEYGDSGFEVNNAQILSLRESLDDETVDELLELFLNDFQNYLGSLSIRIEAGNFAGLSAESHTIKSGCANIGAEKLRKLVFKLEQESEKSTQNEIRALFNKLADEYIYVKEKIKNRITLGR